MSAAQKAAQPASGTLRDLPLGDELQATVARLKDMADRSGDALFLSDGPVHADYQLLDLCSAALHAARQSNECLRQDRALPWHGPGEFTDEMRAFSRDMLAKRDAFDKEFERLVRAATKLPATTPAGIYAKALVVRCSKSGAAIMAMSLASEMIACRDLRASLWPANAGSEA